MLVAIGFGASIGARRRAVEVAIRQLSSLDGISFIRCSRWVRTRPLAGGSAQGWFLNGVALFEVAIPLIDLLGHCRHQEDALGRHRNITWGDRPLDIDLILAEGTVLKGRNLTIPHPALYDRPFVLQPLLEVWPEATDPRNNKPIMSGVKFQPLSGAGQMSVDWRGTPTLHRGKANPTQTGACR
jgi:2-amino-4-hydroxy-6-hydroxymethyldihydropteridine diphosphokinase